MLTRKCNALCDHCGVVASPQLNEVLTDEDLEWIIREASMVGIKRISVTGGEPTLYINKLIHLIKLANKYDIKVGIISNGWWGRSKYMKKKLLDIAKEYHVEIAISIDDYHSKFISPEASFAAVVSTIEHLNQGKVISMLSEDNETIQKLLLHVFRKFGRPLEIYKDFDSEGRHPDYLRLIFNDSKRLTIRFSGVGQIGRGESIPVKKRHFDSSMCKFEISIDSKGYIKPCCASIGPGFEILRIGKVRRDGLESLINFYKDMWLGNVKIYDIMKWFYIKNISDEIPPFGSPCELCYHVNRWAKENNLDLDFKEIYSQFRREIH